MTTNKSDGDRFDDAMDRHARNFAERPRRSTISFGLSLVLVLALVSAGGLVASIVLSPVQIAQKTFNADNVVYNQAWFQQTYQDVQAQDLKIAEFQAAAQVAEDPKERTRLFSVATSLKAKRSQTVADYNARARGLTTGVWTWDLPKTIQ